MCHTLLSAVLQLYGDQDQLCLLDLHSGETSVFFIIFLLNNLIGLDLSKNRCITSFDCSVGDDLRASISRYLLIFLFVDSTLLQTEHQEQTHHAMLQFGKYLLIKYLFGILVIVSVNVINCVVLVSI